MIKAQIHSISGAQHFPLMFAGDLSTPTVRTLQAGHDRFQEKFQERAMAFASSLYHLKPLKPLNNLKKVF